MSIKKFFLLTALFLAPSVIAMEQEPEVKKARVNHEVDECIKDLQEEIISDWMMKTRSFLANLDVAGVRDQLILNDAQLIADDEREDLYGIANNKFLFISVLRHNGMKLVQDVTNPELLAKYSFNEEVRQIAQIKKLLYAYKFLKQFKFPQAHFTPKPYSDGPHISLDKILEALIVNEKEEISVCCYHLTLYNIAEHLVAQKNEGVQIEVVTNKTQGNNVPLHALKHIVNNGILVKAPKNNDYEDNHHKFFIFSSNVLNKPLVWSGSYNPTGHANKNSWDDIRIDDDAGIVQKFRGRFLQIKEGSLQIGQEELQNIARPSETSLRNNNVPENLW